MAKCETCKAHCKWIGSAKLPEHGCLVGYVPLTNADRIRSMSDEKLAEWLSRHLAVRQEYENNRNRTTAWLDWLKAEVKAND